MRPPVGYGDERRVCRLSRQGPTGGEDGAVGFLSLAAYLSREVVILSPGIPSDDAVLPLSLRLGDEVLRD